MTLFNLSVYCETTGGTIGHCLDGKLLFLKKVMTVPLWQTDFSLPSLRSEELREQRSSSAERSGTPARIQGRHITRNTHKCVQKWYIEHYQTDIIIIIGFVAGMLRSAAGK